MKLVEFTLEFFVSRNDIMSIASELPYKVKRSNNQGWSEIYNSLYEEKRLKRSNCQIIVHSSLSNTMIIIFMIKL